MSLEGQQLGEFEILERLGQGGMGAVYKARQTSLDRIVALKTLQSALAGDADYIARFRQEAKAAALLNHPNLVHVHSAGENDGLHWFAMEYVEGESAQKRIDRKGRIDPLEAIAIVAHVATALDYGWRKAALIHRDIKPDNIFLSSDGEVKLGDLGLAKSAGQTQGITAVGASMGTPHYISPEQAAAMKDVDLRADIYSLGCTLYHLLAGQPPYHGDSAVAVMINHVNAPVPDIREHWPECPAELAEVVMKMMQKQPAERQQSYEEVAADLQRAYDAVNRAGAPSIAVRKRPMAAWLGAAAAACVAAGALIYFAPWKNRGQPSVADRHEKQPAAENRAQSATPRMNASSTPAGGRLLADAATPSLKAAPAASASAPARTPSSASSPASASAPAPEPAPSPTPKPPSEIEKWLALVDGPQEEAFQKQVVKPFETGAAGLRARYLAAIDAAGARARAAGQLQDALAWRSERQSFEKTQNVPPDDAGAPPAVKALRQDFRQELAKIEQDRAARAKLLHAQYDAILAQNQILLTQRQRLDDALLLKKKREQIALAWLGQPSATGGAASSAEPSKSGALFMASKERPFENALGMKFVPVPGTNVLFSIWDTRVRDYAAYAHENKVDKSWKTQSREDVPVSRGSDDPVVGVSWNDAQGFCQWLTKKESSEGTLPKGANYRLPTDEEWSRAVGLTSEQGATPAEKSGKNNVDFPWGTGFPPPRDNVGNYADSAYHEKFPKAGWIEGYSDGYATTSPVGSFPANAFGLYDMGGNVWQWCEDWVDASQKDRVVRGGCFSYVFRGSMLSSARDRHPPAIGTNICGFRCVLAGE